jgi:hypothetical protein
MNSYKIIVKNNLTNHPNQPSGSLSKIQLIMSGIIGLLGLSVLIGLLLISFIIGSLLVIPLIILSALWFLGQVWRGNILIRRYSF